MKIVQNCKTLVLLGAAAVLLTGCTKRSELVAEVSKALEANVAKSFANLTFEESSHARGMHPKAVFSGKTSTILVLEKPEVDTHSFLPDDMNLTGLAITKNGRYFFFTYSSPLIEPLDFPIPGIERPCVDAKCRYFRYTRSTSRQAAMEWFYNSDKFTPEKFKELFDEDAPPKKVEA